MNRFNLTFSGEILTGYNPADVKRDFGKLFAIDDPERLENFFSGQTVVLRRNLERKDAADYFHQLNLLGAVAALVKVNDDGDEAADPPEQPVAERAKPAANGEEKEVLPRIADIDPNAQVWAVSSRRVRKTPPSGKKKARAAALDSGSRMTGDLTSRIKARLQETQQQAEEAVNAEAEQAALQKQVVEESAQQAEAAARREAEAAARLTAEREEQARREAEETARRKAEEEEQQRREAEAAARLAAEREEQARREAEEAARRKAEEEEQQRREAEAAARLAAEREEQARREAEETARRKAEQEEQARREAEETARRKAEQEEQQHREAEAAARLTAEREEQARHEAEEAARRRAEQEEQQHREAEAAARLTAEREEQARRDAEEAARRRAEQEEQQHREAEAAARLTAEREEQARREAEEAARRKAEQEERQHRKAEEAARRRAEEEFRQLEAKEAADLKAELEEIKRQEEAEAQRIRADARRRQLQAEQNFTARLRAARSELQLEPIPEESLGANALPGDFNTLRRSTRDGEGRLPTIIKKRQPGEPNLYTLRPFRNTREVQSRCERARRLKKRFYTLGVLGLVLTLVTAQWFFQSAPRPPSTGVSAVASDSGSALVLLSGQSLFLHDRSGVASGEVPLETLGLLSLSAPLAFDPEDSLVAPGVLAGTAEEAGAGERQLLRCNLEESSCRALAAEPDASVDAFVINSLDGSVITAGDSGLVKLSAEGKVIASTEVDLPERPLLRLHAGLLFANSAEGPGISVYRYEDSAFGKQLDEILLLPPAAVEAGHSRVGDFVWSGGAWWASLYDPKSGDLGLYRFDDEWSSLGEVRLPFSSGPIQLSNWGEKTLVNDLRNNALQRYNAAGEAEIPFLSASLENRVAHQRRRANLKELAWRGGLLVAVLLTLLGLGTGALQSLRQRVYKTQRERGAAPVDEESYLIQWIEPVPNRPALLRYRSLCYGLLCAALLLLGIAASVSVWQLAALMLVLAGPAVALMLLARQPIGHIGILGNRLLLVDHSGMYHIAGGSGIQHRGPYLLIDDVVVFCGNTLFPAFQSSEVRELLQSMTAGGVRVDRKTVLVKLLQGRHPLALGAGAILLCAAAAAILLSLQGIF